MKARGWWRFLSRRRKASITFVKTAAHLGEVSGFPCQALLFVLQRKGTNLEHLPQGTQSVIKTQLCRSCPLSLCPLWDQVLPLGHIKKEQGPSPDPGVPCPSPFRPEPGSCTCPSPVFLSPIFNLSPFVFLQTTVTFKETAILRLQLTRLSAVCANRICKEARGPVEERGKEEEEEEGFREP